MISGLQWKPLPGVLAIGNQTQAQAAAAYTDNRAAIIAKQMISPPKITIKIQQYFNRVEVAFFPA
jgi:hypothetical protein